MEELKFELETITENEVLKVKDYESTLAKITKTFAEHPITTILNDGEKKAAKQERATLNKIIKAIDRTRIDAIEEFCGRFSEQCKAITNVFNQRTTQLSEVIKTYEDSLKLAESETKTTYVATLKFDDKNLIEKIETFCNANNIKLVVKEA